MRFARFLRHLGLGIFWLTSAYLVLTLLIALSEQGNATSDVYNSNLASLFYPVWYANGDFIAAAQMAVIGYPASLVLFGFGSFILFSKRERPAPPPRVVPGARPEPAPAPLPESLMPSDPRLLDAVRLETRPEDCCLLDSAFIIRSVGRHAAELLGAPAEQLLRRPFTTFLSTPHGQALRLASDTLRNAPQEPVTLQLELRHADHIGVAVEAQCRAGLGPDGQVMSLEFRRQSARGPLDDQLAAIWY